MKVCEWTQTPVAEVRGDDEKIRRVSQVFAKQLAIFLLFRFTQSSHQYRDDAELIFMAVFEKQSTKQIHLSSPRWRFDICMFEKYNFTSLIKIHGHVKSIAVQRFSVSQIAEVWE